MPNILGGYRWSARRAIAAAAACAAVAVTAFAPQVLNDGDTFLHIAAGRRMLADHAVLFADPFSYTFGGAPWEAHEWLAEVVMALCYAGGGWSGLMALFACAAGLTAAILSRALGRFLAPSVQAAATLLAMACMTGSLLARPHLLALPLLAVWTAELVAARADSRVPSLWLLPLMSLWVNIHASFLLGFAVAAGLALEALWQDRAAWRRLLRDWGLFGLGALAAAAINPHFLEGVIFPFTLMGTPGLAHVGEWQATTVSLLQPVIPAAAATIYILVTRRVKISLVRMAMLAILLFMAIAHARHQIVLAVVAPLLLAEPLGKALHDTRARRGNWFVLGAVSSAAAILLVALRLALPLTRGDAAAAPMTALAHVPAALRTQPVLNDYSFGGYLIFAGVRPFIDSRAELYGEAGLERYAALIEPDGAALDAELRRRDIRWSILSPGSPIVAELDARPGWRRLYGDRYAVVQFRDNPAR
ncbi:MAG: hypothetical protein WDN03_02690 [Rhizomicrobium sp.]